MTSIVAVQTAVQGGPSTMGDGRSTQHHHTTLIRHAARTHGNQEMVFCTPDGG